MIKAQIYLLLLYSSFGSSIPAVGRDAVGLALGVKSTSYEPKTKPKKTNPAVGGFEILSAVEPAESSSENQVCLNDLNGNFFKISQNFNY